MLRLWMKNPVSPLILLRNTNSFSLDLKAQWK